MKKLIFAALVLLIGGCSSLNTGWDYNPEVNFTQYKHYAWVPATKEASAQYQLNGLLDQRVREAVDADLARKGYIKVDAKDADVLVNYLTKLDKRYKVDSINTSLGYSPFWGPHWYFGGSLQNNTQVKEYDVGTLIIDMVDAKTNKLVWRGTANGVIRDYKTPQQRIAKMNEAVVGVLNNFPPKPEK
ncbi:DUF4136 domain-containing protein [Shewanella yunxiaonensis]|uniref:DUF4136 domain-containing protein n=1 Tax=Shewanella yunxiaonensis TaxID=2829809 RepID=A0ABX7YV98_9GAMM|nr:DUF4136 domain-containing protein [Shewanella yunxiaonensis]QUN06688.1 DUF4136 domain-containing protein [Shewanella yunxiaonensis]